MRSDYWDKPAFETIRPRRLTAPLVFNSCHSGRVYPERFLAMTQLDHLSIRQSEDAYVDELFARAPMSVTLYVEEIPEGTSWKHNNLHKKTISA